MRSFTEDLLSVESLHGKQTMLEFREQRYDNGCEI